jgi:hypothetical protein
MPKWVDEAVNKIKKDPKLNKGEKKEKESIIYATNNKRKSEEKQKPKAKR